MGQAKFACGLKNNVIIMSLFWRPFVMTVSQTYLDPYLSQSAFILMLTWMHWDVLFTNQPSSFIIYPP